MKILVIGGMHGNEPLGLEVVNLLTKRTVDNIDTVIANERAVKRNCRFTETDLNRCFPGNSKSKQYETRRAAELAKLTKDYDLVLDFHNTTCPNNDCSFIGDTANELLYGVSTYFGLSRVIVADYNCLNKYAPNCISIEISLASEVMNADYWVDKIIKLATLSTVKQFGSIEKYKFVYRMTLEDKQRLKLTDYNLQAFTEIDATLAKKMAVSSPAFPIFINDAYTPYNYGGLLNKINV